MPDLEFMVRPTITTGFQSIALAKVSVTLHTIWHLDNRITRIWTEKDSIKFEALNCSVVSQLGKFGHGTYSEEVLVIPDSLYEFDVHKDESSHWTDAEEEQIKTVDVEIVVESVAERFTIEHDVNSTCLVATRVNPTHHTTVQVSTVKMRNRKLTVILCHLNFDISTTSKRFNDKCRLLRRHLTMCCISFSKIFTYIDKYTHGWPIYQSLFWDFSSQRN